MHCPNRRSLCWSGMRSAITLRFAEIEWEGTPMSMTTAVSERPLTERAIEALRRAGNPFRNYFARNPDDEVCARYHVPELYAAERDLLLSVVDLYRYDPTT